MTAERRLSLMVNGLSILVAEDDPNDGWLLRQAFRQAGVAVPLYFVRDGQEVIDYFQGNPPFENRLEHPLPTLLLLDLKMPRLNGFEALAWLRQQPSLRKLIVFAFSSSPLEADRKRAYELGAENYVVKPDSLAGLVEFAQHLEAYLVASARGKEK